MENINNSVVAEKHGEGFFAENKHLPRRQFFGYFGAAAGLAAVVASGCKVRKIQTDTNSLDLGKGDFGILNYAYALEQLEAAFYTKVTESFYTGITAIEKEFLMDIKNDEVAHREWFKKTLFLNKIQDLKYEFDFSSVNFSNRNSVLKTAKMMEDIGVSAYNGAGPLLKLDTFVRYAGKIVSVEARHAAAIRDLISYGDFAGADAVDAKGLDLARTPMEVIDMTAKFFKTRINGANLPTS
ncbi:MAG: ferritin-like domain-containing protein [Pedobacter sp.]|nr:ferritin-like domain-containing protein [Pedobacter sp.]MDQ8053851.1 ferritin-like domain-containing protein [Pedobacter sp.]